MWIPSEEEPSGERPWSGGADAPRGRGGRPVGSRTGGRTLAGGVGSGPAHHGAVSREAPLTGKPPNATRDPPRTAPRDGPSESGGGRRGEGDGGRGLGSGPRTRNRVGGVRAPGPGASRRERSRGAEGQSGPLWRRRPHPAAPASRGPADPGLLLLRSWGPLLRKSRKDLSVRGTCKRRGLPRRDLPGDGLQGV